MIEEGLQNKPVKAEGKDDGVEAEFSIMFYFTPEYEQKHTDLLLAATTLIEQANNNYRKNKLPIKMKYFCHELTPFAESTSNFLPGEKLFGKGGVSVIGFILNQFGIRNGDSGDAMRHTADIAVVMAAELPEWRYLGLGGQALPPPFSTNGLSIAFVFDSGASSRYTFDHEVAHLFGAHHDRRDMEKSGINNTVDLAGYGYMVEGGFRTIMAYTAPGHRRRIPYYSAPKTVTLKDGKRYRVGDKDHNNRGVLIRYRFLIASIGREDG